jgi:AbrB family looped-hinge helix DNA binding protein
LAKAKWGQPSLSSSAKSHARSALGGTEVKAAPVHRWSLFTVPVHHFTLDHPYRYNYRNTIFISIGAIMTSVTVSPKYQIVIPKEIRESMGIVSGQKVQITSYQGRIEVIPLKPMQEMRGFLEGIDTTVPREEDRV